MKERVTLVKVFITKRNGWWVLYGEGTPIGRYLYCSKQEAKSKYFNEFIKPLHVKHKRIEIE